MSRELVRVQPPEAAPAPRPLRAPTLSWEAVTYLALGLLAAIPAVVFYNKFAADSSRLSQRLEAFADEFSAIVSRQIDVRT